MKEIERIIEESALMCYIPDNRTYIVEKQALAKALEQYVIKARIEENLHLKGDGRRKNTVFDKRIAELKKGLTL